MMQVMITDANNNSLAEIVLVCPQERFVNMGGSGGSLLIRGCSNELSKITGCLGNCDACCSLVENLFKDGKINFEKVE